MIETFTQKSELQNFCKSGIHYMLDGKTSKIQIDEFKYMQANFLKLIQPTGDFYGMLKKSFKNDINAAVIFGRELDALCDQFRNTVVGIKENGGLVVAPDALYFEQKFNNIKFSDFAKLQKEFRAAVRKCIASNYRQAERLNEQGCGITIAERSKFTQQKVAEEIVIN